MSIYFESECPWFLLNTLLDWLKVLAACHIGFRLVWAYERRTRLRASQHALQIRVRELEEMTEELKGQLQQILEAERFAVALQLTSGPQERAQYPRESVAPHGVQVT